MFLVVRAVLAFFALKFGMGFRHGINWHCRNFIAKTSSTSPPRGNKVDGLPRAASLGNQRAKCDNIGPQLFGIFGRLFGHNSSCTNSFWLRLFVVRVLYHMQVVEHTRCSRKFIGKSFGGTKVLHMSKNDDFERFGGIFWAKIRCFSCAARTIVQQFGSSK